MTKKLMVGIGEGEMCMVEVPSVRLASKRVKIASKEVTLYGIGHLALALRRSTATIRRWQRKGIIQPPLVATADKVRWYTQQEVEMYKRLMMNHDLMTGLDIEATGFPREASAEVYKLRKQMFG